MTSTPITDADAAKQKVDDRLSVREKMGYGLGDAGGTVITCLIMNFLTFSIPMYLVSPLRWWARCLLPFACLTPFPIR